MGLTFTKLGFFEKKEIKIVIAGLDCAGKTTIIYKLKHGETVETNPTIGYTFETFEFKDVIYDVVEVGGQTQSRTRPLWKHYYYERKALIYVVDSNDSERISDSRDLLDDLLNTEELRDASLLVYANRQDYPNAMKAEEITHELGLNSLSQRQWHIQSSCATSGKGLHDGMEWLSNNIDIQN